MYLLNFVWHLCVGVVTFVVCFREELATLQHQVEILGRSLQQAPSTPSIYQAPTTHTSTANRNVPITETDTRPDDTRDNTTRHPGLVDQGPRVSAEQYRPDKQPSRTVSRQQSRSSILNQQNNDQIHNIDQYNEPVSEENKDYKPNTDVDNANTFNEQESVNKPMEVENVQEYQGVDPNYVEGNYENYEQNQANAEYQNQGYEQNYEQPAYTGEQYGQYDENQQYGEYPQQYVDPNAQYEGQYENYATDGTYQGDQTYDQSQHQEYTPETEVLEVAGQDYVPQSQETNEVSQDYEPNARPESRRTVSPNDKLPSQS